ncbi:hypothetical protein M378DRAFT_168306 [Amanita muscaria Koide BX008]|uniref:Uncharacterized protein n=1 Tax=Amanita muscaria (strain Koide BX008) TaxID=946122 RepID=A0A0C2WU42_AMAMK|nr:hypothetical protein M378DRAFT_168306 [Amanita muscaria Koide BX008]
MVVSIPLTCAGTSNGNAVHKLFPIAVSGASDDMRRVAVQLLSESYNPHVGSGATLPDPRHCLHLAAMLDLAIPLLYPRLQSSIILANPLSPSPLPGEVDDVIS